MMDNLAAVAMAARKAALASEKRNETIRAAASYGETIREIAKAAGLSPARVHQILHGR